MFLVDQSTFLPQDKRKLEREKTFYWGQAEELRMSAAAGGRADPSRDADHVQLVEQTRELIEENRQLRQRAQVAHLDPRLACFFFFSLVLSEGAHRIIFPHT